MCALRRLWRCRWKTSAAASHWYVSQDVPILQVRLCSSFKTLPWLNISSLRLPTVEAGSRLKLIEAKLRWDPDTFPLRCLYISCPRLQKQELARTPTSNLIVTVFILNVTENGFTPANTVRQSCQSECPGQWVNKEQQISKGYPPPARWSWTLWWWGSSPRAGSLSTSPPLLRSGAKGEPSWS